MYTYYDLLDDINYLSHFCIYTGTIGSSECGRLIPYVHLGEKKGNQIIVTGGIHAREHVSSLLVIKQVFYYLKNFDAYKNIQGGIYFVPMVNPDGNLLIYEGLKSAGNVRAEILKQLNCGSTNFEMWKANINGVDLNTNFDAKFGGGKYNVFSAGAANYVGEKPFSECETIALRDFTSKVSPKATISYHALGQELYWQFGQSGTQKKRDYDFANYLNSFLNYKIIPDDGTSTGGYKDYCVDKLKIPSFTIEIVSEKYSHPLTDESCIDEDFLLNKDLPQKALEYINTNLL